MPRRVLVVDDVPHMLGLLCRILGDALGSEAEVCAERDGSMALVRLALNHFDLVVTDLRMPGASGLDVLREAKRQSPGTEVLIVTGFANPADLREADRLGAFGCVGKPFHPDELAKRVREALSRTSRAPGEAH